MTEFNYKELAAMAEDMIERASGEDQSRLMTIHNAFIRLSDVVDAEYFATPPAEPPLPTYRRWYERFMVGGSEKEVSRVA